MDRPRRRRMLLTEQVVVLSRSRNPAACLCRSPAELGGDAHLSPWRMQLELGLEVASGRRLSEMRDPEYGIRVERLQQRMRSTRQRPFTVLMLGSSRTTLGFAGSDREVLASAARTAPRLLAACSSAAAMWAANAATVSPSSDTAQTAGESPFTTPQLEPVGRSLGDGTKEKRG